MAIGRATALGTALERPVLVGDGVVGRAGRLQGLYGHEEVGDERVQLRGVRALAREEAVRRLAALPNL